jgi:hypothetical protein
MARVKFGTIVTDARGKVGGNMFQANRYGRTFKVNPKQPKRQTPAQQVIRNRFQLISRSWAGLSSADKQTWYDAVMSYTFTNVFGDTVAPTGQLLFQRLNMNMLNADLSMFLTAPTVEPVQEVSDYEYNIIPAWSQLNLKNVGVSLDSDHIAVIEVTKPISKGIQNVNSLFVRIHNLSTWTNGSDFGIENDYVLKYGRLVPSSLTSFARVRFLNKNCGLFSPPVINPLIVL